MYETVTKNYRLGPALIALAALTAMPILLSLATLMLVGVAKANSTSTTTPGEFPDTTLGLWSEKSFSGNTRYELVDEEGRRVLRGSTAGQASVLYKEQTIDLDKTPWLDWSWRIDRTYSGIDEQARDGDDFPARLYVVAQIGFLPWETLAVNYVWASNVPTGTIWRNPYTDKAVMIAVQSGDTHVGEWISQRRNVAEDFAAAFDQPISELSGFAIMVDGDNSDQTATAWFGNIDFTGL